MTVKVKITIKDENKWIRADLVHEDGSIGRNIYHVPYNAFCPLFQQIQAVIEYVRYYGPDSKDEIEFITDPAYYQSLARVLNAK